MSVLHDPDFPRVTLMLLYLITSISRIISLDAQSHQPLIIMMGLQRDVSIYRAKSCQAAILLVQFVGACGHRIGAG